MPSSTTVDGSGTDVGGVVVGPTPGEGAVTLKSRKLLAVFVPKRSRERLDPAEASNAGETEAGVVGSRVSILQGIDQNGHRIE